MNASEMRYCRIKPKKGIIGAFDDKKHFDSYREKAEVAAEDFIKHNEAFIRQLLENKDRKHAASS